MERRSRVQLRGCAPVSMTSSCWSRRPARLIFSKSSAPRSGAAPGSPFRARRSMSG